MSKPKNMTPEEEVAWREKRRTYAREWYASNSESVRERRAEKQHSLTPERREACRTKERLRGRKRYKANPFAFYKASRKWRLANPQLKRRLANRWYAANSESVRAATRKSWFGRRLRMGLQLQSSFLQTIQNRSQSLES